MVPSVVVPSVVVPSVVVPSGGVPRVEGRGVDRRRLLGGGGGLPGVDHGELHVRGDRTGVADRAHLDPVHVADQQGVGPGTRTAPLGAGRVGAVLGVVGELDPGGPGTRGLGADLEAQLVLGRLHAVLPGDADGAVPRHGLRDAGELAAAGQSARLGPGVEGGAGGLAAGGTGQGVLGDRRVDDLRRDHGLAGRGPGVRRESGLASRHGAGPGRALAHDVEADHAGRGGEGSQHHAESQDLLAGGDETGLVWTHRRLLQCGGRITRCATFT